MALGSAVVYILVVVALMLMVILLYLCLRYHENKDKEPNLIKGTEYLTSDEEPDSDRDSYKMSDSEMPNVIEEMDKENDDKGSDFLSKTSDSEKETYDDNKETAVAGMMAVTMPLLTTTPYLVQGIARVSQMPAIEVEMSFVYSNSLRTICCEIESLRNLLLAQNGGPSHLQFSAKLLSSDQRKLRKLKSEFCELGDAEFRPPRFKFSGKYTWEDLQTMKVSIKLTGARKGNWKNPGRGFKMGEVVVSLGELELNVKDCVRLSRILLPMTRRFTKKAI